MKRWLRAQLAGLLSVATLGAADLARGPMPTKDCERQLTAEINLMRADPSRYAAYLESRARLYKGKLLYLPNQGPMVTREGVAAVRETIRALRSTAPLPPLSLSPGLILAARDHVQDIGPKGLVSHQGSDGSRPLDRIRRHLRRVSDTGEVISFGMADPRSVILDLLIDDSVPSRAHRRILLDQHYQSVGASCGTHAKYGTISVIDLASIVVER